MEKHLFKKIYAIFIRIVSLWHFEPLLALPPAHCDHSSTPGRWSQEHRDLFPSNPSRVTLSLLAGQTLELILQLCVAEALLQARVAEQSGAPPLAQLLLKW